MKLIAKMVALVIGVVVLAAQSASGAAYIKFDAVDGTIEGESNYAPGGSKWCDMTTFVQALEKPGETYSARRSASGAPFEVVVTKELDKASPKISEACVQSPVKVFPKVEIHLLTDILGSQEIYLKIVMTNVVVTEYSISGDADDRPTEEFSLNYDEVTFTYTPYDSGGSPGSNVAYTFDAVP